MASAWTCPHCGRPQMVGDTNSHFFGSRIQIGENEFTDFGYNLSAIACLNEACRKVTLTLRLSKRNTNYGEWHPAAPIHFWRLLPESSARPQPNYIPKALRDDYVEACRIRDLSPKASATLARRCLQGMIRHFCGINKSRLIDEINALREAVEGGSEPRGVTIESVDAIDHVRKIGNIGAHMEKDVNLIIDIEPGEAQALIELIEMLFDEWYVEQNNRTERLKKIAAIGEKKSATKAAPKIEAKEETEDK